MRIELRAVSFARGVRTAERTQPLTGGAVDSMRISQETTRQNPGAAQALVYDTDLRAVLVVRGGKTTIVPIANVVAMAPANEDDLQEQESELVSEMRAMLETMMADYAAVQADKPGGKKK